MRLIQFNSNNEFHIVFDFNREIISKVKQITGRKWDKRGFWTVPATPFNLDPILDLIHTYDFRVDDKVDIRLKEVCEESELFTRLSGAVTDDFEVTGLKKELRGYQKAGIHYASISRRMLISDPCGVGKTWQALGTIHHLNAYPALIIVPAIGKHKWQQEVLDLLPDHITVSVNSPKECCTTDVSIINYDNLKKFEKAIVDVKWQSIVFDESHRIKSTSSQRGKISKVISSNIPVRIGLSATPIVNAPKDLVHPLDCLGRIDEFGGAWRFYEKFCGLYKDHFGWKYEGAENLDELETMLRSGGMMVRRDKFQVMPWLPPKTIEVLDIDVDNMDEYNRAVEEARRLIRSGADNSAALQLISKLRQVAARGKLPFVKEFLKDFFESGEKMVVFAFHREIIFEIASWYSGSITITGDDSPESKWEKNQAFQKRDDIKLAVVSTAIGEVINLDASSYSIHAELVWTNAEMEQNTDRVHRSDSKFPVTCYVVKSDTSIDRQMYSTIERKKNISVSALDLLKTIIES